jgi:hypothetical protein
VIGCSNPLATHKRHLIEVLGPYRVITRQTCPMRKRVRDCTFPRSQLVLQPEFGQDISNPGVVVVPIGLQGPPHRKSREELGVARDGEGGLGDSACGWYTSGQVLYGVEGVITHILCDGIHPIAKPVAPDQLLRSTVRLANQRDRHAGDIPRLHHISEGLVEGLLSSAGGIVEPENQQVAQDDELERLVRLGEAVSSSAKSGLSTAVRYVSV